MTTTLTWDGVFRCEDHPAETHDTIEEAEACISGLPPGTRLILASENLLDTWGARTDQGYAIRVEWGEPNKNGWYTPTFTIDYNDRLPVVERGENFGDD
jgi:hypothetical protein